MKPIFNSAFYSLIKDAKDFYVDLTCEKLNPIATLLGISKYCKLLKTKMFMKKDKT